MKNYLANLKTLNGFILSALALLFMPSVMAGTLTGPNSSTTGHYTISSTANVCSHSSLYYQLNENNVTIQSGCAISKSFNGKPAGTYNYALLECEYDPDMGYNFCEFKDNHIVVVKSVVDVNPNENAEVRLGDYDSDGLTDIFVKSNIAAPYILKQTTYNSFQLITGLTTNQVNTYSTWGFASQILAYVSDLNIDGTDDLMLVGINNHMPAAADQVVRSQNNGSASSAPANVSAMNDSTKRFLVETLGLSQDRDYLQRTMIDNGAYSLVSHGFTYAYFNTSYLQMFQMSMNGGIYVGLDENPYNESVMPNNCFTYSCIYDTAGGQWRMYVYAEVIEITWDYSIFHPSTVDLDEEIDKVESGNSTLDNLLDIFESQVGYTSCNGISDDEVDVFDNVHSFSYFRTNTCTFALLARFINAFSYKELKEIGDDKMQFRANRIGNNWWNPFFHASISNPDHTKWYSGMPTAGSTILLGLYKYVDDDPKLTLLVGFIDSVLTITDIDETMYAATTYYDNKLEYSVYPSSLNSGYNSNGFAKGLINLVGDIRPLSSFKTSGMKDTIEISISNTRFPGLDKPVPKSKFGH